MNIRCPDCEHDNWFPSSNASYITCKSCKARLDVPKRTESEIPKSVAAGSGAGIIFTNDSHVWGRGIRRVFIWALLVCMVVSALTAIVAILTFNYGVIKAKIFLTTLSLGAYGLTGLCCAVLGEKKNHRPFASMGIAISVAAAIFVVLSNWGFVARLEVIVKGRFALLILAISFAHVALLLLVNARSNAVRMLRMLTIGLIVLTSTLLLAIVVLPNLLGYVWPLLSVIAILNVLGTVVTPIVNLTVKQTGWQNG